MFLRYLLIISINMICQYCCSDIEAGSNPAVIQRLSQISQFMLPVPDQILSDTLLQTAQWFIPNHAESEECRNHSVSLLDSLMYGDSIALELMDAAGKIGSGFLDYETNILGNYRQCLQVKDASRKFIGKYCTVTTRGFMYHDIHMSKILSHPHDVVFSLCVPSSCSEEDVAVHVGTNLAVINASVVNKVMCLTAEPPPFRAKDYFAMLFFTLLALLATTSTIYSCSNKTHPVLKAFSLPNNFKNLMDTRGSDDEISCLNGLRVIFTVVLDTFFPASFETNTSVVDGFFLISGIVLAYNTFQRHLKNIQFKIIPLYIQRYFRLTPVLACVILYYSTLLIHQGQGPVWYNVIVEEEICNKNWWAGLLHVANYMDEKCIMQSYYVACDFQFYLMSPLFLWPLLKRPRVGLLLLATASLASAIAATVNAYVKRIGTGALISAIDDRHTVHGDSRNYTGIHYRIPSFCMGLALGYFLFQIKIKKHDFNTSKRFWWLGWTISILTLNALVLLAVIVSDLEHKFSAWFDPLYIGFQRSVFCAAMCWIIFACSLGHGGTYCQKTGLLNQFLSWSGFRPLGKLTFGVFLLHCIFVMTQLYNTKGPTIFSLVDQLYLLSGDLIISFAVAFVSYLSVEAPCSKIASYLLSVISCLLLIYSYGVLIITIQYVKERDAHEATVKIQQEEGDKETKGGKDVNTEYKN